MDGRIVYIYRPAEKNEDLDVKLTLQLIASLDKVLHPAWQKSADPLSKWWSFRMLIGRQKLMSMLILDHSKSTSDSTFRMAIESASTEDYSAMEFLPTLHVRARKALLNSAKSRLLQIWDHLSSKCQVLSVTVLLLIKNISQELFPIDRNIVSSDHLVAVVAVNAAYQYMDMSTVGCKMIPISVT